MAENIRRAERDIISSGGIPHGQLDPSQVGRSVYYGILECARTLRADVFTAIHNAWEKANAQDADARETKVLKSIIQNSFIAQDQLVPLCQDTGTVWICLEVGEQLMIPGNIFSEVHDAVARAYIDGKLRMSIVKDAIFDRSNTLNNTPPFCEVKIVPGRACKLHIMLKGGGSDNASRVTMLPPSAGRDGIIKEVLDCVRCKAANACPPLVLGIGIGATFDKVAGLSKHALLRKVGSPALSPEAAALEKDILAAVNATNIGPGALGGRTTALAAHIESAPCHIAALPLAINMSCCALRSATYTLVDEYGTKLNHPAAQSWEVEGAEL